MAGNFIGSASQTTSCTFVKSHALSATRARPCVAEHAWAPKGPKAISSRPVNYGSNVTVTGAISIAKGPLAMRTMAGAVNSERFCSYIRDALPPKLMIDDAVVLDNLQAHHVS